MCRPEGNPFNGLVEVKVESKFHFMVDLSYRTDPRTMTWTTLQPTKFAIAVHAKFNKLARQEGQTVRDCIFRVQAQATYFVRSGALEHTSLVIFRCCASPTHSVGLLPRCP